MSKFTPDEVLTSAKQLITGNIPVNCTTQDAEEALTEAIRDLNGGEPTINPRNFYRGSAMFAFVEQLITVIENEGLKGDEFFMNYVDYRNVAEGDQLVFYTEDMKPFVVSEIGRGNQAIRRQRLSAREQLTVTTTPHAIRIFEHLSRLTSGRVKWTDFVKNVTTSVQLDKYESIYKLFSSITDTTPGMKADLVYKGTYNEDSIDKILSLVEAEYDIPYATIIGTSKALRQLKMDTVADQAKSDLYNMGYYGRFLGRPTLRIRPRFKTGTRDFIFPDDKLYIIAGKDKFIKFVTEGKGLLDTRQAIENYDLTQEYWYITMYGVALMINRGIGMATLTTPTDTPAVNTPANGE